MATPLERLQAAWATGDSLALDREVEQLAEAGCSQPALETALETLLREVRSKGADDASEEIIHGVWDRLTGWCHSSRHIATQSEDKPPELDPGSTDPLTLDPLSTPRTLP